VGYWGGRPTIGPEWVFWAGLDPVRSRFVALVPSIGRRYRNPDAAVL